MSWSAAKARMFVARRAHSAGARLHRELHAIAADIGEVVALALDHSVVRDRFTGIENADSLIIDPHKWLYAPFDCAALLYRDPSFARVVHTQDASYLDVIHEDAGGWRLTRPSQTEFLSLAARRQR